jgi:hypothetical protein
MSSALLVGAPEASNEFLYWMWGSEMMSFVTYNCINNA